MARPRFLDTDRSVYLTCLLYEFNQIPSALYCTVNWNLVLKNFKFEYYTNYCYSHNVMAIHKLNILGKSAEEIGPH